MTITRDPNDEAFHHGLQCCVRSVSYDFRKRAGRLDMEDGDCCDMTGCIHFFQAIDPEVRKIETFSGDAQDTVYERRSKSRSVWRVVDEDDEFNDCEIPPLASNFAVAR